MFDDVESDQLDLIAGRPQLDRFEPALTDIDAPDRTTGSHGNRSCPPSGALRTQRIRFGPEKRTTGTHPGLFVF